MPMHEMPKQDRKANRVDTITHLAEFACKHVKAAFDLLAPERQPIWGLLFARTKLFQDHRHRSIDAALGDRGTPLHRPMPPGLDLDPGARQQPSADHPAVKERATIIE